MEFPNQSHLADISMKRLHHQSIACINMEWRVQQHAREAVESTVSGATSTIQITSLSAARMKKDMEEFIPDWRVDQGIQKSSVFQYTTRVEGSSYSSAIGLFSYKSNQHIQEQSTTTTSSKYLSSRLQPNYISRWMLKSSAMM